MTEEDAYNIALQELQGQNVTQGIWAKAMAFSDGDEKKAKANYLRFRAAQLLQKERVFVSTSIGLGIATILFSPYGRMSRWLFATIVGCAAFVIILGTVIIDSVRNSNEGVAITLYFPFFAASAWSLLAAHIKRARDAGMSPYLVLIYLIPFLGWLFLLGFLFTPTAEESHEMPPSSDEKGQSEEANQKTSGQSEGDRS